MAGDPPVAAHSRRRRIVRIVIVVAVLVLLIGGPAWLAGSGQFFARFPALAAQHAPWATSAHAEVGCQECHIPPRAVDRVSYRVRMIPEFYLSFVSRSRVPSAFASPTNESCLRCHNDLRSVSPKGDLQIPHRAHVTILKMNCVECHNVLVHELNTSGNHAPAMAGCLRCHDGDTAKNTCTACHTQKDIPDSHRAKNWLVVHPEKANGPECDSCHKWTENWCVDCHVRRPASHGEDWREVHGDKVKDHRNCEACHDAEFCVRCHGEVPSENFDPALKMVE